LGLYEGTKIISKNESVKLSQELKDIIGNNLKEFVLTN